MSHDDIIIMKDAAASDVEGHAKGAEAPEKQQPSKEHTTTKCGAPSRSSPAAARRATAATRAPRPSAPGAPTRSPPRARSRSSAPCSSRPSRRRGGERALAAVHEDLPDHAAALLQLRDMLSTRRSSAASSTPCRADLIGPLVFVRTARSGSRRPASTGSSRSARSRFADGVLAGVRADAPW
ncbi:hypothetical protein JL722_1127 [Aureococcus anophagefferens]|nr:hypothetical protein JL722_1127 [Aureococcus anophagefferens]